MTEPAARWWRRWWLRPSPGAGSAPGSVDLDVEWRPGATPLTGDWAQAYERCRSSVSAYDRVVATMDPGPLRGRLTELRADLETPQALAAGWRRSGTTSPLVRPGGRVGSPTGQGRAVPPARRAARRTARRPEQRATGGLPSGRRRRRVWSSTSTACARSSTTWPTLPRGSPYSCSTTPGRPTCLHCSPRWRTGW